ncbi:MAG: hypothetical protein ACXVPU_07900 [Bacteroidia bacterium]
MNTYSNSEHLRSQSLKEKQEKLNSMLAAAKKLEDRIDEARRVLTTTPQSIYK